MNTEQKKNISKGQPNVPNFPKKDSKKTPANVSGLFILKGAIEKVLGVDHGVIVESAYESATKVLLTVPHADPITDEQKKEIQDVANDIIQKNVAIRHYACPRGQLKPVREQIPDGDLTVLEIENYVYGVCPDPVLPNTGEVQGLFIQKARHKSKHGQVEFMFIIQKPALDSLSGKKGGPGGGQKLAKVTAEDQAKKPSGEQKAVEKKEEKKKPEYIESICLFGYESLSECVAVEEPIVGSSRFGKNGPKGRVVVAVDEILKELSSALTSVNQNVDKAQITALQSLLQPRLEGILNTLNNQAYAEGFASHVYHPPKFFP